MLNGFVKVRRGIVEHLHNGQMNLNEFACYCVLLLKADYKTGVAWVNSGDFMLGDVSLSSVQRALLNLEQNQYIKRFVLAGSKKPYPVLIDKFEIADGDAGEPKRINAVKSTSWKYPVYEGADEPLRSRWGGDAEPLRSRNGAVTDALATPEESTTSEPITRQSHPKLPASNNTSKTRAMPSTHLPTPTHKTVMAETKAPPKAHVPQLPQKPSGATYYGSRRIFLQQASQGSGGPPNPTTCFWGPWSKASTAVP
jgi:hypothetical protein